MREINLRHSYSSSNPTGHIARRLGNHPRYNKYYGLEICICYHRYGGGKSSFPNQVASATWGRRFAKSLNSCKSPICLRRFSKLDE